MSADICIRGCLRRGEHFAACPAFGREDGECRGCVPRSLRDGAVVCERCFYRLRRALEDLPDLVGMLRAKADPLKALDYTRAGQRRGSRDPGSPAPVSVVLLDAIHDLMLGIGVSHRDIRPGQDSGDAYEVTLAEVGRVLEMLDAIVADEATAAAWCDFAFRVNGEDERWTIAGALKRWPLEERARHAAQPCPECGLRSVKVSPPRHKYARLWLNCESCGWRKNELDDDGLWAAAFGFRHDDREEGHMAAKITRADIDTAEAVKAAQEFVEKHPELVKEIGAVAAAVVGAIEALGEQFAKIAEQVAADARAYQNGDLIAGGARMTAKAIRDAASTNAEATAIATAELEQKEAA